MEMKKLILVAMLMSFGWTGFAQDFIDNALLFSRTRAGGSARIQAIGGTQVSLGGDYSSALSNPAGLGMYNRSEFTFTPALTIHNASSNYLGTSTDDSRSVFNIPGISLVFNRPSQKEKGFLSGSFAITMSRINDLNRDYTYSGANNQHSIIDYFIADAYGVEPSSMLFGGNNFFNLTALAYNNYLTEDFIDETGNYAYRSVLNPLPAEPGFPAEVRTVDQQEISEARGAQNQWSFSYGANFNDKIFVGAGLGITSIRYDVRQLFRESNYRFSESPDYNPLNYFQTDEEYDITGSGVNLSIGAIYRPVNFLQVGASFVTPTYYSITDNYTARIDSEWNYFNVEDNPSFPGQPSVYEQFDQPLISEYNLRTPMKLTTGATYITPFGFISADVEFVNYSKARYDSDIMEDFNTENQIIKGAYQSVINYRVGAEYRIKMFRLRGGYNYMADPYQSAQDVDQSIQSFSAGAGFRSEKFFIDFAGIFSGTERRRIPYSVEGDDPMATQKLKTNNFMVTVGFNF